VGVAHQRNTLALRTNLKYQVWGFIWTISWSLRTLKWAWPHFFGTIDGFLREQYISVKNCFIAFKRRSDSFGRFEGVRVGVYRLLLDKGINALFWSCTRVNWMGSSSLPENVMCDHLLINERVPECISFRLCSAAKPFCVKPLHSYASKGYVHMYVVSVLRILLCMKT